MESQSHPEVIVLATEAQQLNLQGQPFDALQFSLKALAYAPTNPAALFETAFAYTQLGDFQNALVYIDTLCADSPAHTNALWLRANILRRTMGDYAPQVRQAYLVTIQNDPENQFATIEYADILRANGCYETAYSLYSKIIAAENVEEPLRLEALFNLGIVCQLMGDVPAARSAFRKVLDASPDYPDAQEMYDMLA